MEPKKINKLVLKPETIANLSNPEQNHVRGGTFPSTGVIAGWLGQNTCQNLICNSNYGGCGGGGDPIGPTLDGHWSCDPSLSYYQC